MSYLETKRNAIMNAIASGQLTNLLANKTWASGYFSNNGSIVGASASNKEKYEQEYIEVDTTKNYLIVSKVNNLGTQWWGIATYDSEGVFKQRTSPITSTSAIEYAIIVWKPTYPKARVSLRTFGDADIGLYDSEELTDHLNTANVSEV